ncbi:CPBP family intramembrane glutamic endopeptidase [Algoriphagus limi]|uniref:CPBP family intramembrane metalloprotease n=1 Tax=Algoriphagus limi TaxID=2975273 RepID=A0ABT2G2K5_9BACT|nr:type II CAAX endopeptidase family protein [Algoriphagus limi]MCS5489297.1 CPBP family intramembrane metalloprotease [Algoriphagus limi]
MKNIFINPSTKRLKAGWRILLTFAILIGLNIALGETVRAINGSLKAAGTLWFTVLGISATIAAYLGRKYFDRKSLASLGLNLNKQALLDLLFGVANSALVMLLVFAVMLNVGLIEFDGLSWWTEGVDSASLSIAVIPAVLALIWRFMVVAWWEELFFRGIIFQNIREGLNLKWAITISTLVFALIHAGNPSATVLSTVMIIIITLQLVYAYLKTQQLWMPIGLHLGWNFFQASIFGFASSGHKSPSLISQHPIGPDWLSGGEFGAEGSILLLPLVFGSIILINLYVNGTRGKQQSQNVLSFDVSTEGL